ncbi:hypothetical protein Tco_1494431 [Tanacetum coccineum]
MSSSSFCFQNEKEREEMIMFLLRGRVDDLNSMVDDLSSQIEHMVPRSELELEKRRVAKWKRRADERRICANRYYKDVCALEDQLESSRRRYRNLVGRTRKCIRAYQHRSKVDVKARAREKKLLKSLVHSRHSVSMENQRLRAKIDALKALLVQ